MGVMQCEGGFKRGCGEEKVFLYAHNTLIFMEEVDASLGPLMELVGQFVRTKGKLGEINSLNVR